MCAEVGPLLALCIDLPGGNEANGSVLQVAPCTPGNENQIWRIAAENIPPEWFEREGL